MLPRPTEVQPRGQYRIWLRYSDGVEGLVDLSHLAGKGVFQTWTEPSSFDSVYVAPHGAIAWGEDIELCPDALYIQVTGMSAEEVKLSRPATSGCRLTPGGP